MRTLIIIFDNLNKQAYDPIQRAFLLLVETGLILKIGEHYDTSLKRSEKGDEVETYNVFDANES